jgi:hypothetical protein
MKIQGMLPFLLLSLVAGIVFGVVWVLAKEVEDSAESVSQVSQLERLTEPDLETSGETLQAGTEGGGPSASLSPSGVDKNETQEQADATSAGAFFLPQNLDAAGSFVTLPQPVTWSASCETKPQLRAFEDLRDFVRLTHPLVLTPIPVVNSKTETGINILHLNQFLRDEQSREFLQYSIVHGADPAMGSGYRIERYRFRDSEMNEILGNEVLLPLSKRFDLDVTRVRTEFQKIMDGLKSPRYVAGARILVYTTSNLPKTGAAATRATKKPITATIELTGGLVTGYATPDVSCESQLLASGAASATVCECLFSSEAHGNALP